MVLGPNTTGWEQLMDANLVGAVYLMFNTAFAGYVVALLFIIYQVMLFLKTRNLALCFSTSLIFASLYVGSVYVHTASVFLIFLIILFELAGILYMLFWK